MLGYIDHIVEFLDEFLENVWDLNSLNKRIFLIFRFRYISCYNGGVLQESL